MNQKNNVYLTKNQIHDMFHNDKIQEKEKCNIQIPSFGDLKPNLTSPEFQMTNSFIFDSFCDDLCKDSTKREPSLGTVSEDLVKITKKEYKRLIKENIQYQKVQQFLSSNQLIQENQTMKQKISQLSEQLRNTQSQLFQLRENNKKQQSHIFELLECTKQLEQQNQQFQEGLLKSRLQLQDEIQQVQQSKIDSEQLKIQLLQKNEIISSLQDQISDVQNELDRIKSTKSVQRSTCISMEQSPLKKSHYPSQPHINKSFSNNIRTRPFIRQNL